MKKLLALSAALFFVSGSIFAQTAESVLERYYEVSGLDKVDLTTTTAKIDMTVTSNGMTMTMANTIQMPDRLHCQFTAEGKTLVFTINGNDGWVNIPFPGIPAQDMTPEQLADTWDQADLFSSMKWNLDDYTLTLGEPEKKGKKLFDVVEMVAKDPESAPFSKQELFIDSETGLPNRAIITIPVQGRELTVKVFYKEFAKSGEVQYPKLIETRVAGGATLIEVTTFLLGYPVSESMFTRQ